MIIVKDIAGYEGIYKIDEYGNVFRTKDCKLLQPFIARGYKYVGLCKDGVVTKFSVHRLVAMHFIPNPYNYPIVMHKDNVKLNTHYSNLEWGTTSMNAIQAVHDGLTIVPYSDTSRTYIVFNENYDDYHICVGSKEVSQLTEITNSMVRNCLFRETAITQGPYSGYYIGIPRRI